MKLREIVNPDAHEEEMARKCGISNERMRVIQGRMNAAIQACMERHRLQKTQMDSKLVRLITASPINFVADLYADFEFENHNELAFILLHGSQDYVDRVIMPMLESAKVADGFTTASQVMNQFDGTITGGGTYAD